MEVKFELQRKACILTGSAFAVMLSLCITSKVNIVFAFVGSAVFFLIQSVEVSVPEKVKKFNALWAALLLLFGAWVTTCMVQYLLLEQANRGRLSANRFRLNILCAFVLMLVILIITARAKISCIAGNILLLILGGINYFVYQFRGNEFSFGDVKAASTGLSVAAQYEFKLDERAVYVIIMAICYVALMLKVNIELQHKWMARLAGLAAAIVCCSYVAVKTERTVTESWEQKGTYRNGYILNFILSVRDSFVKKPEGYSAEQISGLEEQFGETKQEGSKDDPTIIVIMNESFADLSKIGPLKTNEPVTPFLDSLRENTVRGYALASVYGAKTPNSEWEFLTGNSMAFLPSGSVAYQQYLSGDTYSLVSTLKERGYKCLAMHPYFETGWSRNKVYPMMGFEEMHFISDFNKNKTLRAYITDEELYDKIIQQFEDKEEAQKLFIMSVTMQNHGGYTDFYPDLMHTIQMTNGYYSDVNQYLTIVNESDKALEKLISYFEGVDEKVEIVFFGDHQPGLNSEFYRQLNGKGLSGLSLKQLEDLFTVPFFIWTNYESEEREVELTSLNFLSTMALEKADIELPAYNRFLKELMESVPAMNSRAYYSKQYGVFRHYEDSAASPEESILRQYEMLQYNNIFDQDKSRVFFPFYSGGQ